ncbi:hypothetical protein [Streptomyces sp. Inha503]|uniref:NACHT N-terminal Helical domain 1-containing protein n=1 Tax=Streptomyces sp. Inha503 TaxID=3383314 RepID=UPI0039A08592
MSAEAAAINLGRTVANRVVRLWLEPRRREQESRMEMSALVRRRVPGLRAQRGVERQFEQIADAVAARLEPMCGHEFRGLEEGGRRAALDAVTAAFGRADLSDEAILGSDANPAELARRVRASAPPPAGLGEAATHFYELVLAGCCDCYVRILQRLPVFTERGIAELLGRVGELGPELSRVLGRLPVPPTSVCGSARMRRGGRRGGRRAVPTTGYGRASGRGAARSTSRRRPYGWTSRPWSAARPRRSSPSRWAPRRPSPGPSTSAPASESATCEGRQRSAAAQLRMACGQPPRAVLGQRAVQP